MPAVSATAPGKIILFGEHAVVYGRPAIAAPVLAVNCKASVFPKPLGPVGEVTIQSDNIGLDTDLTLLDREHPIRFLLEHIQAKYGFARFPAMHIKITSTIPLAGGLGSSASVSVALIRAISGFLDLGITDQNVSELAFLVEKIHHGTPSGIDNTVITYAKPVFYKPGHLVETLQVEAPIHLLIADSGHSTLTRETVAAVRKLHADLPEYYESLFDSIEEIVKRARECIEIGNLELLGLLMTKNHNFLKDMSVSSPALDQLVNTALDFGALGAKLSGGGRGGNIITLVSEQTSEPITQALLSAGATRVIASRVLPSRS